MVRAHRAFQRRQGHPEGSLSDQGARKLPQPEGQDTGQGIRNVQDDCGLRQPQRSLGRRKSRHSDLHGFEVR